MSKAIIGVVETPAQADTVVRVLQRAGIPLRDVSVLFPDTSGTKEFAHQHNTKAPEGAVAGVGAGGAIGGTLGLLAGIGALAIPGLGPFIAAGPILAALSGAAAGAAVGGVSGALVGLGFPEYEAKVYEGRLRNGQVLIAVHTEDSDMRKRASDTLKSSGATDVTTVTETAVPKKAHHADVRS